ncbi:chemotaxis protein CheX [Paenibacillus koleovorans]|uniref:chemotaxis protein CheX n=1 Tax=Paenibacillus koleovorans TaxID=121608 RepID=UPI000FDACAB1|nr:chemotaxis protein CheX [Paenibacillus koleovorans]
MSKVGEAVLGGYLGLSTSIVEAEESAVWPLPLQSKEVGVIIQVIGQLEGQVICSMELGTAKGIVGRMMGGMTIERMDEMGWSAFQEFGNWIVSGIATELSQQGIAVNITHPLVQEGAFILRNMQEYSLVIIETDIGELDIYITLERPAH